MKSIVFQLSVPPDTPPDDALFLAGNFNDWIPDDERFRFEPTADGRYRLQFVPETPLKAGLACKVTRGKWSTAECAPTGRPMPNRLMDATSESAVHELRVDAWMDRMPKRASSAEIHVLHTAFDMPQLGRKRRIWALLPPDYHQNPNKRYPVVYMQDGQNLFDNPQAVYGSWNVDKALNRLFMQQTAQHATPESDTLSSTIIIGIENGGDHRISEYSPWIHPKHGGGEGKRYLSFICDTLKPFVDTHLRTLPERTHTGILGSSMGGLISLYAALSRPDVFGMAGVFSPSLWFSNAVFSFAKTAQHELPVKILLMAGHQESDTMVSDLLNLYEILLDAGHADENLHYDLHSDGAHAEWFWAREFEHALTWLMETEADDHHHHHDHSFHSKSVYFERMEAQKTLLVGLNQRLDSPVLEIHDYCHDRVFRHPVLQSPMTVSYADWEDCVYSVRLLSDDDLVFSRRVYLNQLGSPLRMFTPKIDQL